MGDGAGAACTGVERALAERVKAATGGEAIVLSTCARLDVYSYADADKDLAAIVSSDIGGAATQWRAARLIRATVRTTRGTDARVALRRRRRAARLRGGLLRGPGTVRVRPFRQPPGARRQTNKSRLRRRRAKQRAVRHAAVGACCGWRSRRARRRATGNRSAPSTHCGARPSTPWRSRRRGRKWRPPSRTKCSSPPC